MLLLIRNERECGAWCSLTPVMDADYPTILTHLLHYPSPSPTYPFNPALILTQAKFLRNNISPAGGVEVVLQNQEHLGVKASGPDSRNSFDDDGMANSYRVSGTPPSRSSSSRPGGKPKGLAAGLFERAQKAGLDKAFADLRVRRGNAVRDDELTHRRAACQTRPRPTPSFPALRHSRQAASRRPSRRFRLQQQRCRPDRLSSPHRQLTASRRQSHCSTPSARWPSSALQW